MSMISLSRPAAPVRARGRSTWAWLAPASFAVVGATVLAAYVPWPLAPDHGIMGLVGRAVARGGVPYRDAFDTKGPLSYLFFAAVERAFGPSPVALRAMDAALLAAGAVAFALSLRRSVAEPVAWGAAALWTCLVPAFGYENTMQPDGWVALATAPVIVWCWTRPDALLRTAVLGAVAGAAVMVKPIFLVYAAVPPVIAVLARRSPRAAAARAAVSLGAAASVVLAVCAWFALRGALGALFDAYVQYNRTVYWGGVKLGLTGHLRGVVRFWIWTEGRFLAPVAVAGAVALWRRDARLATLIVGWALCTTALVALQGRFFPYQWSVLFPPLCLLVALGAAEVASALPRALRSREQRWALPAHAALAALVASALFVVLERNVQDVASAALLATGRRDRAWFDERFARKPLYPDESNVHRRAAAWLKENVPEGRPVALWAFNPVAVWLSGHPVSGPVFGWPLVVGEGTPQRERFRAEFMSALRRDPPAAILVDPVWETNWTLDASVATFPEFADFLQGYDEAARIGGLRLLRRREPRAASGAAASTRERPAQGAAPAPRSAAAEQVRAAH